MCRRIVSKYPASNRQIVRFCYLTWYAFCSSASTSFIIIRFSPLSAVRALILFVLQFVQVMRIYYSTYSMSCDAHFQTLTLQSLMFLSLTPTSVLSALPVPYTLTQYLFPVPCCEGERDGERETDIEGDSQAGAVQGLEWVGKMEHEWKRRQRVWVRINWRRLLYIVCFGCSLLHTLHGYKTIMGSFDLIEPFEFGSVGSFDSELLRLCDFVRADAICECVY